VGAAAGAELVGATNAGMVVGRGAGTVEPPVGPTAAFVIERDGTGTPPDWQPESYWLKMSSAWVMAFADGLRLTMQLTHDCKAEARAGVHRQATVWQLLIPATMGVQLAWQAGGNVLGSIAV